MISIIFDNEWLKVKQNGDYIFCERKGKDSIAFILLDNDKQKFGLVNEYKPPLQTNMVTAFGGSIDDIGEDPFLVCIKEIQEETGYDCYNQQYRVKPHGKHFVSTQMNQFCYLYLVDVTDLKPGPRQPQDRYEEEAQVVWINPKKVMETACWKAKTIVGKSLAECFSEKEIISMCQF